MRPSQTLVRVEAVSGEDYLVSNARLQPPATPAQQLGIPEVIDERVRRSATAAGRGQGGGAEVGVG